MSIFIYYNINRKYFENHSFKDVLTGLHKITYKHFWVYERNEDFNKCFENWLSKSHD